MVEQVTAYRSGCGSYHATRKQALYADLYNALIKVTRNADNTAELIRNFDGWIAPAVAYSSELNAEAKKTKPQ